MNDRRQDIRKIGMIGTDGRFSNVKMLEELFALGCKQGGTEKVEWISCSHSRKKEYSAGDSQALLERLTATCENLSNWPVDVIFVTDILLSPYRGELQRKVKLPVIDVATVALEKMSLEKIDGKILQIAAGESETSKIFSRELAERGIETVPLEHAQVVEIKEALDILRKTETVDSSIREDWRRRIENVLKQTAAVAAILAEPELFRLGDLSFDGVSIVNPFEELLREIIRVGLEGKAVRFDADRAKEFWRKRAKGALEKDLGVLQSSMLTSREEDAENRWEIEKNGVLEILKTVIKPNDYLLEPGCGTGRWSRELIQHVEGVTAFDPFEEFIEVGKGIQKNQPAQNGISYQVGDILSFESPKRFDGLFCAGLLNYLSEKELRVFVEMAAKCVATNGWLFLKESIGVEKRLELHGFYSETLGDEYYSVYRTERELVEALQEFFTLSFSEIIIPPVKDKPETCQKAFLFRRKVS